MTEHAPHDTRGKGTIRATRSSLSSEHTPHDTSGKGTERPDARGGARFDERVRSPRVLSEKLASAGLILGLGAGGLWSLVWLVFSLRTGNYVAALFSFLPALFFAVPAIVSLSTPLWGGAFLAILGIGLLGGYASGSVVAGARVPYLVLLALPVCASGVLFFASGVVKGREVREGREQR